MSRWLKSVNSLLDTLDGSAEHAAHDTAELPTSRGTVGQILSRRGLDYDDEEEDYEDDEEFYSTDDEYIEDEIRSIARDDFQKEEKEDNESSPPSEDKKSNVVPVYCEQKGTSTSREDDVKSLYKNNSLNKKRDSEELTSSSYADEATELKQNVREKEDSEELETEQEEEEQEENHKGIKLEDQSSNDDIIMVNVADEESSKLTSKQDTEKSLSPPTNTEQKGTLRVAKYSNDRNAKKLPQASSGSHDLTKLSNSPPENKLLQQLKKCKQDLKKSVSETRQLRKHIMQLNQELEAAEAEVKAQQDELKRAAERMEKDRHRANEEREDLLDEQDEELENQKAQYEKEIVDLKDRYEDQIEELEDRLSMIEEKRKIEGGDWTKELEDALQREREGLKKLNTLKDENSALKSSLTKLETQNTGLQTRLESSTQANQTSIDRERHAEDKLDAALSLHSRQLNQRQAREAELERVIADMGAALVRARQKERYPKQSKVDDPHGSFKEKFEMVIDEVETLRAQLTLETERSDALRNEMANISKERTAEALEAQANFRQHDREVSDLKSNISRLEAILSRERKTKSATISTGNDDTSDLCQKLEESQKQIHSLSEQLIVKQNTVQNSKQEMLTLKNRLQSATARASSAEEALAAANNSTYAVQDGFGFGGTSTKRRIKGGRSIRSIRTALGMNPGRVSEGMEQVAVTIDAIDSFLVDTGSFMKHEPLARLGFILYLSILHLWSFCLIAFHASTYEDVHGDFGSMSDPDGNGPQNLLRGSKH